MVADSLESDLLFIKQTEKLKNACGLIACFHAIYNNLDNIQLEKDGLL